jgi:hypothetical protein
MLYCWTVRYFRYVAILTLLPVRPALLVSRILSFVRFLILLNAGWCVVQNHADRAEMHRAPVPSPDDEPFGDDLPQPVPPTDPIPDPNPEVA